MMKRYFSNLFILGFLFINSAAIAQDIEEMEAEVAKIENAFAKTMTDRDFDAFQSFIDPDTVFWIDGKPLRGAKAVAAGWKPLYESTEVPFSWKSETVLVNPDGRIVFSTGPVMNANGEIYAYFNSVWRKNDAGEWKIIFDKGTNLNQ